MPTAGASPILVGASLTSVARAAAETVVSVRLGVPLAGMRRPMRTLPTVAAALPAEILGTSTVAVSPTWRPTRGVASPTSSVLVSAHAQLSIVIQCTDPPSSCGAAVGGDGGRTTTGNVQAGAGGTAKSGNSGNANGGSVSNVGGSITNVGGSSHGGNGGVSSSGNVSA